MTRLPALYHGARRRLVWRLVATGFAQAICGLALAESIRRASLSLASGGLSGVDVAIPVSAGAALLGLRVLQAADAERLGQDYVTRVRLRLLERFSTALQPDARRMRWGLGMSRVVGDLNAVRSWVAIGIARSIVASVTLVVLLSFVLWQRQEGLALVLVGAIAASALALAITPVLRRRVQESRRRRGRLANLVGERLIAGATLRQLDRRGRETRRVRRASLRLKDALVRQSAWAAILSGVPDAIWPVGTAVVFLLATAGYLRSEAIAPSVVLLGLVVAALRDLALAWEDRLLFAEARDRICSFLSGPRIPRRGRAVPRSSDDGVRLELDHVGVVGVFEGLDAALGSGEWSWLEGESGSGKSTLLSLIAGAARPDAGQILLGGLPLHRIGRLHLHGVVQWVSPEVPLLRGTVAENLRFGMRRRGDAAEDDGRLERLVTETGLDRWLNDLPNGLATHVEERGVNLPEGLRSTLSLARAIGAEPKLLLIDDPVVLIEPQARVALRALRKQSGTSVVLVGAPGLRMSGFDRRWRLSEGRLVDETDAMARGSLRSIGAV